MFICKIRFSVTVGFCWVCSWFMRLFVLRGFLCGEQGPLSSIFSSWADLTAPLGPSVQAGPRIRTLSFSGCKMLTLTGVWRHRHAFYFQTTLACETEVGCAILTMRRVRSPLNESSLVSLHSEVTLSFHSAPSLLQMMKNSSVGQKTKGQGWAHSAYN